MQGKWAIACFWNSEGRVFVEDWAGPPRTGEGEEQSAQRWK